MGALGATLNNGRSVDVLLTYQAKDLSDYAVIVLPNTKYIEKELKDSLLKYVENGGTLFLVGPESVKNFKEELGLISVEDGIKGGNHSLSIETENGVTDIRSDYVEVKANDLTPLEYAIKNEYKKNPEKVVALFVTPYGKGKFVSATFNVFLDYAKNKNVVLRNLVEKAITTNDAKVKIGGTKYVETVLTEKDGVRMLNLTNISGEHGDLAVGSYDEILPIYSIQVEFACPYKPEKIIAYPDGKEFDFGYENGKVKFA